MTYQEMRCEQLVELITEYLECSLNDETRAHVEQHLTYCIGCLTYLDQMRETIALTGRLRSADVPIDAMHALLAAFRHEHR